MSILWTVDSNVAQRRYILSTSSRFCDRIARSIDSIWSWRRTHVTHFLNRQLWNKRSTIVHTLCRFLRVLANYRSVQKSLLGRGKSVRHDLMGGAASFNFRHLLYKSAAEGSELLHELKWSGWKWLLAVYRWECCYWTAVAYIDAEWTSISSRSPEKR